MAEQTEFQCPYCGELNSLEYSRSEGKSQSFIQDCEVCCRPIEIDIRTEQDGFISVVIRNDEGF